MLKFCPIKGCWRLQMVRIEYNNITKFCCRKHEEETNRIIREELTSKKE